MALLLLLLLLLLRAYVCMSHQAECSCSIA
jgi:hypothetical protein